MLVVSQLMWYTYIVVGLNTFHVVRETVLTVLMLYCFTGVLIGPWPDQERNKLLFLSEWREFPSAPCLAEKKKLEDSSRICVLEITRVPDMLQLISFLVGLRTYQLPGNVFAVRSLAYTNQTGSVRLKVTLRRVHVTIATMEKQ